MSPAVVFTVAVAGGVVLGVTLAAILGALGYFTHKLRG